MFSRRERPDVEGRWWSIRRRGALATDTPVVPRTRADRRLPAPSAPTPPLPLATLAPLRFHRTSRVARWPGCGSWVPGPLLSPCHRAPTRRVLSVEGVLCPTTDRPGPRETPAPCPTDDDPRPTHPYPHGSRVPPTGATSPRAHRPPPGGSMQASWPSPGPPCRTGRTRRQPRESCHPGCPPTPSRLRSCPTSRRAVPSRGGTTSTGLTYARGSPRPSPPGTRADSTTSPTPRTTSETGP